MPDVILVFDSAFDLLRFEILAGVVLFRLLESIGVVLDRPFFVELLAVPLI